MSGAASRAKARQRLARAIENTYPRELTAFIDHIARNYDSANKYVLQTRALEYARLHYDDAAENTTGATS